MTLDIAANRRAVKYARGALIGRALWSLARPLFCCSPRPLFAWRRGLLRLFGATVGAHVHVYPSARILLPWNLEIGAGDSSYREMVGEMKKGMILTSNWYTRFTSYQTGEFSTVPRDGAYLVENGEITGPLNSLRISDTLERMFSSVESLSKEREWIQWWEVDVPTLCPWVLVGGVRVTKAYG